MYGVVTRNVDELNWSEFERSFYEVKDVTGRMSDPSATGVNMVSCFGDNSAAEADPSLVPIGEDGELATREQPYFDWAYICPNNERYRDKLVEIIDSCVAQNDDVRLDDVGFPRMEYCHCEICEEKFASAKTEDWFEWRSEIITDFVRMVTERIPGRVYFTLYPDPYSDHLYKRSGIDIGAIAEYVDEFVIPLYDLAYSTTYWIEIIASGFQSRLDTPFSLELYAINIEDGNLLHAAEVAESYAKDVLFAYDAKSARDVIHQLKSKT